MLYQLSYARVGGMIPPRPARPRIGRVCAGIQAGLGVVGARNGSLATSEEPRMRPIRLVPLLLLAVLVVVVIAGCGGGKGGGY